MGSQMTKVSKAEMFSSTILTRPVKKYLGAVHSLLALVVAIFFGGCVVGVLCYPPSDFVAVHAIVVLAAIISFVALLMRIPKSAKAKWTALSVFAFVSGFLMNNLLYDVMSTSVHIIPTSIILTALHFGLLSLLAISMNNRQHLVVSFIVIGFGITTLFLWFVSLFADISWGFFGTIQFSMIFGSLLVIANTNAIIKNKMEGRADLYEDTLSLFLNAKMIFVAALRLGQRCHRKKVSGF